MNQADIVIFAGTTEGRALGEQLERLGVKTLLCVATSLGEKITQPGSHREVHVGRLDQLEMQKLLKESHCEIVVDATHPYADIATKNISAACYALGIKYFRLEREICEIGDEETVVSSMQDAARLLADSGGKALLTVGSKDIGLFTSVPNFDCRLYLRVLPTVDAIQKAISLGFSEKQLICMQGPFSEDLNLAMLRQLQVDWLVTKESGAVGGFPEKRAAAWRAGVKLLVVGRPASQKGLTYAQVLESICDRMHITQKKQEEPCPRFPMFVDLTHRKVLVIGGGQVAERRVRTMLQCGARVTVISPFLSDSLRNVEGVDWQAKKYSQGDIASLSPVLVVAATNRADVNHLVWEEAKALGIPCNVADDKHKSTYWFPAFIKHGNLVAGIVSTDGEHSKVKKAAADLRNVWEGKY